MHCTLYDIKDAELTISPYKKKIEYVFLLLSSTLEDCADLVGPTGVIFAEANRKR